MLALLLERGQRYSDIAELLGGDESSVRERARAALAELAGADPDRNVGLTDYLLGQADPIGRADAARHLRADPEDLALARDLASKLREIAPEASLPRLPGDPAGDGRRRLAAPRVRLLRGESRLSREQGRLIAILGFAAVILLVVVLAVAGAFSGGSSAGPTTTTSTSPGQAAGGGRTVALEPVGKGSQASGTMLFSTAGQQPYFELQVSGLAQPPRGKAYVAWLMFNGTAGHPLTPVPPGGAFPASGTVHVGPTPLSDFQVPLAQRATAVQISLSDAAELNRELRRAVQRTTPIIPYQGTTVLRGVIARG